MKLANSSSHVKPVCVCVCVCVCVVVYDVVCEESVESGAAVH